MKRLLFSLPLLALLTTACQKTTPDLIPTYEGHYQLQFSTHTDFDTTPVTTTTLIKGSLSLVKNPDGTYTFTEKWPDHTERTYQVRVVGSRFEVPTQTEAFPVNGVLYTPQFVGSGEFTTNQSVTITRIANFTAGLVRVNSRWTSYGYR